MIYFDVETEEYAIEEERLKKEWNQANRDYCKKMVAFVNQFLASKTEADEKLFLTYFSDEQVIKRFHGDNKLAFVMIMRDILVAERKAGVENVIINCADTLEDMVKVIRQVKFLLWEIEFLDSEESFDLLMEYQQSMGLSNKALARIILSASYDKEKIVCNIK